MSSELRERLRQKTGQARAHQTPGTSAEDRATASPGQVYVLAECAEYPVEWAILEVPSLRRRLAVPLDDQTLVGSADIAISGGSPTDAGQRESGLRAPAVLRCAHAIELDHRWLIADRHSGHIPAIDVERALEIHRRLGAGEEVGRAIDREVETEPEYRRWIEETVAPAREAVRRAMEADRPATPRALDSLEPAHESSTEGLSESASPRRMAIPSRRGTRLWAFAASVFLALSALLAWHMLDLRQERSTILAELDAARAPVEELRQKNQQLEQRLSSVEQDRDELAQRLESSTPPPDVDPTGDPSVGGALEALINVPLAVLVSGVRGEPEIVEASAEASWIGLVIELQPDAAARYRLELKSFEGGKSVFRREGLMPSRGLLSILLPAEKVPPAAYRLRLEPMDGPGEASTFTLIIERP